MSPGWHCRCLQIASSVEKRIALALPFFGEMHGGDARFRLALVHPLCAGRADIFRHGCWCRSGERPLNETVAAAQTRTNRGVSSQVLNNTAASLLLSQFILHLAFSAILIPPKPLGELALSRQGVLAKPNSSVGIHYAF
jgi:hypothetical protein